MTREEAISVFKWYRAYLEITDTKVKEAIDLAISALQEPKWNCTASFTAEQLEKLKGMTDKEKWDFFSRFFSDTEPSEQVTSKLKNPCDSLLTEDSEDSKEQKSKLDLISRQATIKPPRKEN